MVLSIVCPSSTYLYLRIWLMVVVEPLVRRAVSFMFYSLLFVVLIGLIAQCFISKCKIRLCYHRSSTWISYWFRLLKIFYIICFIFLFYLALLATVTGMGFNSLTLSGHKEHSFTLIGKLLSQLILTLKGWVQLSWTHFERCHKTWLWCHCRLDPPKASSIKWILDAHFSDGPEWP